MDNTDSSTNGCTRQSDMGNCLCDTDISCFIKNLRDHDPEKIQLLLLDLRSDPWSEEKMEEIFAFARKTLAITGSIFLIFPLHNELAGICLAQSVFHSENLEACITCLCLPDKHKPLDHACFRVYWFAREKKHITHNDLYAPKDAGMYKPVYEISELHGKFPSMDRLARLVTLQPENQDFIEAARNAGRIIIKDKQPFYVEFYDDFPFTPLTDVWSEDSSAGNNSYAEIYKRIILLASEPGDLCVCYGGNMGNFALIAQELGRNFFHDPEITNMATMESKEWDNSGASRKNYSRQPFDQIENTSIPKVDADLILKNGGGIQIINKRWEEKIGPLLDRLNTLMKENWTENNLPMQSANQWPAEARALHTTLGKAYRVKMPVSKTNPLLARLNKLTGNHFRKIESLPQKPENPWPEEAKSVFESLRESILERQKEIEEFLKSRAEKIVLVDRQVGFTGPPEKID